MGHASPDAAHGQEEPPAACRAPPLGELAAAVYTGPERIRHGEKNDMTTQTTAAYVSLGSNCAAAARMLEEAAQRLAELPGVEVTAASPVYSTEPQEYADQPWFLNQVLALEVAPCWDPRTLVAALLELEAAMGRIRDPALRFGPRVIDLDLLLFGSERCEEEDCRVPHPRLLRRAFVLVPLLDLDPDLRVDGVALAEALRRLPYRLRGTKIFQ